jgi:hypothetical protein
MLTYSNAKKLFETAKNKENGKPLENNTRLFKRGDSYAVQLHSTDVVTIHANGTYTLDSGGWHTVTTKQRINAYSPAKLSQRLGQWFLYQGSYSKDKKMKNMPIFVDGVTITKTGKVIKPIYSTKKDETKRNAAKKRIKKYVDAFIKDIETNGLNLPSMGDCWDCSMVTEDGRTLGDVSKSNHLLNHIEENYFVPSLLWNAIKEPHYRPEVYFQMFQQKQMLDQAKRFLTKYMMKRIDTIIEK